MNHVDALVGIVVLMAFSLWVVSKAKDDAPFIARLLHPSRRDRPGGVREDDDTPWHWGRR